MTESGKSPFVWVRFIALIVLGYLVAVVSASAVTLLLFSLFSQNENHFITVAWSGIIVGSVLTAMTAWPGYVVTILVILRYRVRNWVAYGAAGVLTAFVAGWIAGRLGLSLLSFVPQIPVGGLAGAVVFRWLFVDQLLEMREQLRPTPQPVPSGS